MAPTAAASTAPVVPVKDHRAARSAGVRARRSNDLWDATRYRLVLSRFVLIVPKAAASTAPVKDRSPVRSAGARARRSKALRDATL